MKPEGRRALWTRGEAAERMPYDMASRPNAHPAGPVAPAGARSAGFKAELCQRPRLAERVRR